MQKLQAVTASVGSLSRLETSCRRDLSRTEINQSCPRVHRNHIQDQTNFSGGIRNNKGGCLAVF
jgi:hypothetical protein